MSTLHRALARPSGVVRKSASIWQAYSEQKAAAARYKTASSAAKSSVWAERSPAQPFVSRKYRLVGFSDT